MFTSEILCPDSEGVMGGGLIGAGTGTVGDRSEQTGSPLPVSLCPGLGVPLPRWGSSVRGRPGAGRSGH